MHVSRIAWVGIYFLEVCLVDNLKGQPELSLGCIFLGVSSHFAKLLVFINGKHWLVVPIGSAAGVVVFSLKLGSNNSSYQFIPTCIPFSYVSIYLNNFLMFCFVLVLL